MNNIYIIIDNDKRLDITDSLSGWIDFVKTNNKIHSLQVAFRSHIVDIPLSHNYYIAKGGFAFSGSESSEAIFICYTNSEGKFIKTLWKTPELVEINSFEDDIEKYRGKPNFYGVSV